MSAVTFFFSNWMHMTRIVTTFSRDNTVTGLQNVNFEVKDCEFAVILGPSGCRKSTMLYLISGFEKPTKER